MRDIGISARGSDRSVSPCSRALGDGVVQGNLNYAPAVGFRQSRFKVVVPSQLNREDMKIEEWYHVRALNRALNERYFGISVSAVIIS